MPYVTFRISMFLIFFFAFGQNTKAAISTTDLNLEIKEYAHVSKGKKQKKSWRLWKNLKAIFLKIKNEKQRGGRHFGQLSLMSFILGIILGFAWGGFFFLGMITSFVLGVIGIIKDKRPGLSIFATLLPIAIVILAVVAFYILLFNAQ